MRAVVSLYCGEEDRGWRSVNLYEGESLRDGASIIGPAIIAASNATTVLETGWQAEVGDGVVTFRVGGADLGVAAGVGAGAGARSARSWAGP